MKALQAGILIPWVNTAMEEEIPKLVHPDVGLHWSRLRPKILPVNGHDTNYLSDMLSSIPDALARFDGLDLHVLVLGCTSANLMENISEIQVPETYRQKIITALDAILFQIEKINAEKIILFAPYDRQTINREVELLESHGWDVVKNVPLIYEDEIRYITTKQIYDVFMKEYIECDAVLFSCTALYTLDVIKKISRGHNIRAHLLSSNIAISKTLNDLYNQDYSRKMES